VEKKQEFKFQKNLEKAKNQHSKNRSIKELQKIIDNAPSIKIGNKKLEMTAKDLTGLSVHNSEQYITRKEMDKNKKNLKFKSTGKHIIKDKK
jgi:C4-type Zn-finger protein|tara:strand:+ start:321 stop:596 length:276 start_codon:yes stop_codon:yes gene_type:complete